MKPIPFSPPDISEIEIQAVQEVMRSGWITTGPRTKEFERKIAAYCGVERAVCLNSATAGLELLLRLLGIGPGDEVITTPYTFAASANVILHVGAKPVVVDVMPGSFEIDSSEIRRHITKNTKAIIPVDFAGIPCDYDSIRKATIDSRSLYSPKVDTYQTHFDSIPIIADAAHSFGASFGGKKCGALGDFGVFSFHAVKNLTTGEGGAIAFNAFPGIDAEEIYNQLMLLALHGQNKDALAKTIPGSWRYDIKLPGYKCNMTDIAASIGLVQLERYDSELIPKRKAAVEYYNNQFKHHDDFILPDHFPTGRQSCYHLYPIRLRNHNEEFRDLVIKKMASLGIATNVHFIPLPMHSAYKRRGYHIENYPNSYESYASEISLPLHTRLTEEDQYRISQALIESCNAI